MKVAIYSGSIPSTVFIENLISGLADQDIEVQVFGRNLSSTYYSQKNINLFPTPQNRYYLVCFVLIQIAQLFFKNPIRLIKLIRYYSLIAKKSFYGNLDWWGMVLPVVNNLPDIFHIQWAKSLNQWFFLKQLFNIRIFLSLRGTHITCSPLADENLAKDYKSLFPRVDKFHAVSKSLKNIAMRYGAKKEDIKVIYSAINYENIKPYVKNNWELTDELNFISVGRFHWIKGYEYSLMAIKYLLEHDYNVYYTIISNNLPNEEILYQIEDLSINEHVNIINNCSQPEVYENMRKSDCLLLPSIEEGIANVALEAMAIGLPVISSDCGGMKDIISHNYNGFLYKNRDYKDLITKIIQLIHTESNQIKYIVNNGRQNIEKDHDLVLQSRKMINFYNC